MLDKSKRYLIVGLGLLGGKYAFFNTADLCL